MKGIMDPEGACLLTYSVHAYGKPCLPPVHRYSSLRSITHPRFKAVARAAGRCHGLDMALHALRRECSSEGSMSSFFNLIKKTFGIFRNW